MFTVHFANGQHVDLSADDRYEAGLIASHSMPHAGPVVHVEYDVIPFTF